MITRHRGDIALMVEGEPRPMRLTLGALAELEHAFSVDSLPALGERFASGR
ncbi:MAG: GTA-gp10 family protein, partial [Bosea sp. (in: a-proteobacteria)]|nr:GTA-gp10 family protein [Bosea sp. (in: a-proteobacteria)]